MKRPRFQSIAILGGLLVITVGAVVWPVWQEVKQKQLNRMLLTAIKQGDDAGTLAALRAGASPNARDTDPPISLWIVLKRRLNAIGHPPVASRLRGSTALMDAAKVSSRPLVDALLSRGADVNASDESGSTALFFAIQEDSSNLEILHDLLASGANVNQPDAASETPLMEAAWANQPEVVQLFLDCGAQVNASASETGTVLYSLKNEGLTAKTTQDEDQRRRRIVSMLVNAGAKEHP